MIFYSMPIKLLKQEFPKGKLREAVVLFTRRLDYLTCLKAREMRIDLEGNIAGEVTEERLRMLLLKLKSG